MKEIIDALDNLPFIAKIILALPFLDIVWVVYRILKSVEAKNTLGIVLGVIIVILGIPFLWLVDIICLLINKKIYWLD